MCNTVERKIIDNVNRLTVGVMATSGMVMDGVQPWDTPCALSLIMWLALPEMGNTAERVYDKIKVRLH